MAEIKPKPSDRVDPAERRSHPLEPHQRTMLTTLNFPSTVPTCPSKITTTTLLGFAKHVPVLLWAGRTFPASLGVQRYDRGRLTYQSLRASAESSSADFPAA